MRGMNPARRVAASFVVLAMGLFSGAASAQEKKVDVTGTWKWSVPGRDGQAFEQSAKLKQEGEKVTGSVTGRQGTETPIENGKISGSDLSFTVTREFNGNKFVSKHSGKVDGETIKGKIEFDRNGETQSRDWEAKREKIAAAPTAPKPEAPKADAPKPAAPKPGEVKPVAAATPGKATGTWKFKFQRDDGTELVSVLKLKQDGEKLTGVNTWNNGPDVQIENGSIKEDAVAFTVTREREGNKIESKYKGKIEGDKLVGSVVANIGGEERTFDLTFERVKE